MGLQVQANDVERAFVALGGREDPASVVSGFLGFTPEETRAGIPTWAWLVLAIGVGVAVGRNAKVRGWL